MRSSSGSIPRIGETPELIASTFQAEVGDFRCTTRTFAGCSDPSLMRALANMAAMGIPTIPGPITQILRSCQFLTLLFSIVSGINLTFCFLCCVYELPMPQFQVQKSPKLASEGLFRFQQLFHRCHVIHTSGPAFGREQGLAHEFVSASACPQM